MANNISAGILVAEYKYDSWGRMLSITGSLKDTVGKQNPFRYKGYYYDSETEMYYLQSRYYDPEIRRFISADRGVSGSGKIINGFNLFVYCFNNPVNMKDQDGCWPKSVKKFGTRLRNGIKTIGRIVASPFKSMKVEAGTGVGLGVKGTLVIGKVKPKIDVSVSITDKIMYENKKIDVKTVATESLGIRFMEEWNVKLNE